MSETRTPDSRSALPGFAELLASLAALKEPDEPSEDPLADDVATLSYERALQTQERRRNPATLSAPPAGSDQFGAGSNGGQCHLDHPIKKRATKSTASASGAPETATAAACHERKCASITVRMSQEEGRLLRERAAEAGITVSAYLRSCAFEVETLRAQVKQTVAELRAANSAATPGKRRSGVAGRWLLKNWWPQARLWNASFRRLWPFQRSTKYPSREPLSA
jgi:hypothetical protein